jgi:ABC-type polysaccharide/polyol phosphate transport system ATPase subunit
MMTAQSQDLIQVDAISKKYCRDLKRSLFYGVADLGREMTGRSMSDRLRKEEFWALSDVSFCLKRGESLGIIGRNGAGKSTLLKLLNGLVKPNRGTIAVRGQVQALIELGAGFNTILTGRENILVNAAVLGIPKHEIKKLIEPIVEFSELGKFIDMPVQSYSSGMKVRLGFAIAINVRPDILLLDEVLAVGDLRFRRKARLAMADLLSKNIALIFISHNLHEITGITQQAIWLENGRIRMNGASSDVCAAYVYESSIAETGGASLIKEFNYMNKISHDLRVIAVETGNENHPNDRAILYSYEKEAMKIRICLLAERRIDDPFYHVLSVRLPSGDPVAYASIHDPSRGIEQGTTIERVFELDLRMLHSGDYYIAYEIGCEGGPRFEGINDLLYVKVEPSRRMHWMQAKKEYAQFHLGRMIDRDRGSVLLPARLSEASTIPESLAGNF